MSLSLRERVCGVGLGSGILKTEVTEFTEGGWDWTGSTLPPHRWQFGAPLRVSLPASKKGRGIIYTVNCMRH